MKILKILGIIILVIILIGAGVIVFGPSSGHLERSITINAPSDVIYEEVSNLKGFNKWSPWFNLDPDTEFVWEGPIAGEGAKITWYSEDQNVGNGYMTITEARPGEFVGMDMKFDQNMNRDFTDEGDEKPTASFILNPQGESTSVTWTFDISNASGFGKMMVLGLDAFLGPFYEQGLAALKDRVENRPEFEESISLEEVESFTFLGQEITTANTPDEINSGMAGAYGLVMEALVKNAIESEGYALSLVTDYAEDSITMVCGMPVPDGTTIDNPALSILQSHDGFAVRGIHFGDYSLSESTHMQIGEYAEYFGYELGDPWEVYVTDPGVETDTAKWITEIFYPIL